MRKTTPLVEYSISCQFVFQIKAVVELQMKVIRNFRPLHITAKHSQVRQGLLLLWFKNLMNVT